MVSQYKPTSADVLTPAEYRVLVQTVLTRDKASGQGKGDNYTKFSQPIQLITGEYGDAAKGFERLLQVDEKRLNQRKADGLKGMEHEIEEFGDPEVSEIFNYVLKNFLFLSCVSYLRCVPNRLLPIRAPLGCLLTTQNSWVSMLGRTEHVWCLLAFVHNAFVFSSSVLWWWRR